MAQCGSCGLLAKFPAIPATGFGWETKYLPVPLTGVAVDVRIIDLVAQVTVTQNYVNKETQPIEAVYLFPIDEGKLNLFIKTEQLN